MIEKAEIYQTGNPWQKKVYKKMALFLEEKKGVNLFGKSRNGNTYKHLLTNEQSNLNFVTEQIHKATIERFSQHKAGDLQRILTNTAASQPYCFNLIIYLQQHLELADKLFSKLLDKQVKVHHLEPEFTPNMCDKIKGFERSNDESIGDQNPKIGSGTDADIAVFYTYDNNKKGVVLIEFKFIEAEFSVCSSYAKKMQIKSVCNNENYYNELVNNLEIESSKNFLCGYTRYNNWEFTEKSKMLDVAKIKSLSGCPFRFGLNQLWRNILLVERVAETRECDEFSFWVFSPLQNDKYLWKAEEFNNTEKQFRNILTDKGNKHFKKIYLEDIFDVLRNIVSSKDEFNWLELMEEKYSIQ